MNKTVSDLKNKSEETGTKFCPPLNHAVSHKLPSRVSAVPEGEHLEIVDQRINGTITTIFLKHPANGTKTQFVVRWICLFSNDRLALLELNDRTLEPEMGIPQVIVRLLDADTCATIPQSEFPQILESMNTDIIKGATLLPAAWNAKVMEDCKQAFHLS